MTSRAVSGNPLVQLTLARLREFYREPDAVFWVLIFPVFLAGGLGLAFREQHYIDFLVPGLLGMSLTSSAIWGVGSGVVDARRRKLLKRLIATPMPRSFYLLSFVGYRLVVTVVEAGSLLAFGALLFGVRYRGSPVDLAALCALTTLAGTAVGLLLAARLRTMEAANGLLNVAIMPMWMLSGVFFPADRFPPWLQPVIRVLPMTAAIDAFRANLLDGAGFSRVLPQVAILAGWTVGGFALALRLFRWR